METKKTIEELRAMFDATALIEKIRAETGVEVVVSLKRRHDWGHKVQVESANCIDKVGAFSKAFESVTIGNFGGNIIVDAQGNQRAWVPVNFFWKHIRGGTNGAEFMTAYYTFETRTWEFSMIGDA
jgi:hypothetical protein